jgi:hypothetical protein
MSSIFDLPERVQRLRQMFSYFKNAALLTGAEVRDAVQANAGDKALEEWASLLSDIRDCFSAAQALTDGEPATPSPGPPQLSEKTRKALVQPSPPATLH